MRTYVRPAATRYLEVNYSKGSQKARRQLPPLPHASYAPGSECDLPLVVFVIEVLARWNQTCVIRYAPFLEFECASCFTAVLSS